MSWAVERQTGRGNDERILRCIPASYGMAGVEFAFWASISTQEAEIAL